MNWQTRKWSNFCKVSSPCLDDHQFKQEELESVGELSEVCSHFLKKASTWHELDDLTFYGRSTNLQEQSQNGLRHVTDDWQDWFRTFITQTISDNIVMW